MYHSDDVDKSRMQLQRLYNLGNCGQSELQRLGGRIKLEGVLFRTRFVGIGKDIGDQETLCYCWKSYDQCTWLEALELWDRILTTKIKPSTHLEMLSN